MTKTYPQKYTEHNIDDLGWLRSIDPKGKNPWLFPMDIDSNEIGPKVLQASFQLSDAFEELIGYKPILKASGKSGAHLYFFFWFPMNWTPRHIFDKMRDLAYTCYLRSGIMDLGFLFGPLKKDGLPKRCPGFVDSVIYRQGVIRAFSIHPYTKDYSVPYIAGETLETIKKRMILEEPMPYNVKFDARGFNPKWKLDHFERSVPYTDSALPLSIKNLSNMVKEDYRGDKYYRALPPPLKAIARMEDDIKHDLKVPLVAHMRYYFLMEPDQITSWLFKKSSWTDLNDPYITLRQCRFICDWVESHKYYGNLSGSMYRKAPLKRIFYDEEDEVNG